MAESRDGHNAFGQGLEKLLGALADDIEEAAAQAEAARGFDIDRLGRRLMAADDPIEALASFAAREGT